MSFSAHTGLPSPFFFFFFNDTATTEIYTLSLHDALPICRLRKGFKLVGGDKLETGRELNPDQDTVSVRSEEHTSELQSHLNLVCRLLLEKKKKRTSHSHRQLLRGIQSCSQDGRTRATARL